jgi:hypothetical protein
VKYVAALIGGIATGALVAVLFVFYNPFAMNDGLSPFAVSNRSQLSLNYSAVPDHAILVTNNGEEVVEPRPERVAQLWEAPIRQTTATVTLIRDARQQPVGLGIKYSSRSERTNILNGELLVDSVWHIFLPRQGSLLVAQTENYWDYVRRIVVPARLAGGDSWKGRWRGAITAGPGPLRTARVHGGSGRFRGLEAEGIETIFAEAYSAEHGPVAMDGSITIEFPPGAEALAAGMRD